MRIKLQGKQHVMMTYMFYHDWADPPILDQTEKQKMHSSKEILCQQKLYNTARIKSACLA